MTSAAIDRVHIFSQYFESGSGAQFARNQALAGTLQHSPLRSLCWRVRIKKFLTKVFGSHIFKFKSFF